MAELTVSEFMTPTSRDTGKDAAMTASSLNEPIDTLSIELSRISAEIQSINSGFQGQIQQALTETRAALENQYRVRFEKAVEDVREQARQQVREELVQVYEEELEKRVSHLTEVWEKRVAHLSDVQKEIERVTVQLESIAKEIAGMLDDPGIELSKVMRKRTEQAELRAYLNGLRYSIGEQSQAKGAGS
jgi:hypothetical protein